MGTVVSADSTIIAYEQTGHGPALVLVHGTGRDRSYWARTLPKLAQHASVYAVDRRGRGESGDAESYSVEREVEDVLAVIDAVAEPVYLLGHSSGAIVALEAAMLTDRLGGLILYELPLGVGTDESHLDLASQLEAMIANGDRETVLVTFLREGPRYPAAEIEAQRHRVDWPDRLLRAHTLARDAGNTPLHPRSPARVKSANINPVARWQREPTALPAGDRVAAQGTAGQHGGCVGRTAP